MAINKKSRVSATEARVHFGEMMRRAELGETLVVERAGQPKVVVMSVECFDRLARRQGEGDEEPVIPEWKRKLDRASEMLSNDLQGRQIDWARIIDDMRDERSRQLMESVGDWIDSTDNEPGGKPRE